MVIIITLFCYHSQCCAPGQEGTGSQGKSGLVGALESISLSASTHQFMDSMYGLKTHLETASSEIMLSTRWPLIGASRYFGMSLLYHDPYKC